MGSGGTHKQQQTLVLPDGPAAAQEAEQEQQPPHRQQDVDARDKQGVGGHDLSEAGGIHHDPDADAQQTGPAQLLTGQSGGREGEKQKNRAHLLQGPVSQHRWSLLRVFLLTLAWSKPILCPAPPRPAENHVCGVELLLLNSLSAAG